MDEIRWFLEWCKTNRIVPMQQDDFGNMAIPPGWASTAQERRLGAGEWSIERLLQYYSDEEA